MLSAGARDVYDGHKRYRLELGPGKAKFVVGGNVQKIDSTDPTGFEANSDGIASVDYQGPNCP